MINIIFTSIPIHLHAQHYKISTGDGELGASLRYLSQRYSMPYAELKGLLTDIGTEEYAQRCYKLIILHFFTTPETLLKSTKIQLPC